MKPDPYQPKEPARGPRQAALRGFLSPTLVTAGCLALLALWHGWMVLSLYGPWPPWQRLVNDEPIITGKHPGNLYLGTQQAQALAATGSCCCYVSAYQAGFPVTPIFNGSRLALLFLLPAGSDYQPAAYKIGLACACWLAPFLLVLAGRAFGLGWGTTLLASAAALLLWWGHPEHHALRNGELELWLGALALLAHAGLLVRFDRAPGLGCWLGLVLTGGLAWFAQPLLLPVFLLMGLVYYLSVGARHSLLLWHLSLLAAEVAALAVNAFWLKDWITFWWLRRPFGPAPSLLAHRTLQTFWASPIWGGQADRALAVFLLGSAVVGTWLLNRGRQRPAARLLGLGGGIMLVLAFLGISLDSMGQVGTMGLLVPALWFASLPAAHAWAQILGLLRCKLGTGTAAALVVVALAGAVMAFAGLDCRPVLNDLAGRYVAAEPLEIGLGPAEKAIVEKLILHTGPEARILWEDRPDSTEYSVPSTQYSRCRPHVVTSHWPALLALLTDRSYIGGLDPEGITVHAAIGFADQFLAGQHIRTWTDVALEEYCRQYNIGWIACWSPAVIERMRQWPGARLKTGLEDSMGQGEGALFAVVRRSVEWRSPERGESAQSENDEPFVPSFTLKGQARLVQNRPADTGPSDSHHITLADVVPDNGVVVLSLHYQAGMRALPSRVRVECEPHPLDPIGFLRLHVAGPVARVTLTWDDR